MEHYGLEFNDLETLSINAAKSSFAPYAERVSTIFGRIKPRFAELRREHDLPQPRNSYWDGES